MTTEDKEIMALQFAEHIARLYNAEETATDCITRDGALAAMDELIASARQLTGIDPGHKKLSIQMDDLSRIYAAMLRLAGGEGCVVAEALCDVAGQEDGMRIYEVLTTA